MSTQAESTCDRCGCLRVHVDMHKPCPDCNHGALYHLKKCTLSETMNTLIKNADNKAVLKEDHPSQSCDSCLHLEWHDKLVSYDYGHGWGDLTITDFICTSCQKRLCTERGQISYIYSNYLMLIDRQ